MLKKIAPFAALAALLVGGFVGASAKSAPAPIAFGTVTGDAEKDTIAFPVAPSPVRQIFLAGPARYVGEVTGVAEKDTFALVGTTRAVLVSAAR